MFWGFIRKCFKNSLAFCNHRGMVDTLNFSLTSFNRLCFMGSFPMSRELWFWIIEGLKIQALLQTLIQNSTKKFPNRNKAVSQNARRLWTYGNTVLSSFPVAVVFLEKKKGKKNEGIKLMRGSPPSNWLLSRHHHSEIGSPRLRHIELLFPLAPWEPKIAVEEGADLFLYLCESIQMKGTELPWQIPTCISTADVQSKCLCIYPHNEVGLDLLRN